MAPCAVYEVGAQAGKSCPGGGWGRPGESGGEFGTETALKWDSYKDQKAGMWESEQPGGKAPVASFQRDQKASENLKGLNPLHISGTIPCS